MDIGEVERELRVEPIEWPQPKEQPMIWAMKHREDLTDQDDQCLVGQVALWGRVFEHRKGFRAQYAYPYLIDLRRDAPMPGFPGRGPQRAEALARQIREHYGCIVLTGPIR